RRSYAILRVWNSQFLLQVAEATTIFSQIHILERRTDDLNTELLQFFRHFQSCLTTQLNSRTFCSFMFDNLTDMLPKYRFKIEFICHIEIRRNSFRVTIDHDSLVATFFCSE